MVVDRFGGGEIGIRTLDTRKRILDFESSAFDHSAISPRTPNYTGFAPSAPRPDLPRYFFAGAAGAGAGAAAAAGAAGAGAAIDVGVTVLPLAFCSAM